MSSLIPATQVSVLFFTIPADANTCPAWQIAAIGLPWVSKSLTNLRILLLSRSFSGDLPPGTIRKSKFSASTSSIDALGVIEYPFLPLIESLVSPMTIVLIPSSCNRYIGWNSSRSSNSSVAIMAAILPFRSFGTATTLPRLDQCYPDFADYNGFFGRLGRFLGFSVVPEAPVDFLVPCDL